MHYTPPASQLELERIYQEGKTRYEQKCPPGYKDLSKSKQSEEVSQLHVYNGLTIKREYGDLIIWFQIIDEAKKRGIKHLVFITDDDKEDWWWIVEAKGKKTIGPRPELVEEISSKAGVTLFYMYNPERFLEFAKQYLGAQVEPESIDQVREIAQLRKAELLKSSELPTVSIQMPGTLEQVLAVCLEVFLNQMEYNEAVKAVAEKRGIWPQTVADKCTRRIGIDTPTFRNLLRDKNELIRHLSDWFPEHENYIRKTLE